MKLATFIYAVICVAALSPARGDVLVSFDFAGSLRTSVDADPNSTASSLTDGGGFVSVVDALRGNASPSLAIPASETDGSSQANAVTLNEYVGFTLTPIIGYALYLTSLSFDYSNYSDSTFPTENFFVRSSRDSYAANLAAAVTAAPGAAGTFANTSISIAGASFQNLTSPVEFRIFVQDSTSTTNRGALIDNVIVNGTAQAVPEPSTLVSLLGGLGLLSGRRWRRR